MQRADDTQKQIDELELMEKAMVNKLSVSLQ
jgi:hypothetical protein